MVSPMENRTQRAKRLFIVTGLILFTLLSSACKNERSAQAEGETGGIVAQALWPESANLNQITGPNYAVVPSQVATVRLVVTGAGMTEMSADFAVALRKGEIAGVPVGANRSLAIQGLDSTGTKIYQGSATSITVTKGVTVDAGTVAMVATDGSTASFDLDAPTSPTISINAGAASTGTTSVTLTLSASDNIGVTGYFASETNTTPIASTAGWTTVTSATSYSTTAASFTLSSSTGTKTVYVWYKDVAGNVSTVINDTITYTPPSISAFSFPASNAALSAAVTGAVSGTDISLYVPKGTVVTSLAPSITFSGSTVSPASGTAVDFTSAQTYTVTTTDGSTTIYTVTVTQMQPVVDTGQTTCTNGAGTTIACPAAGNALAQDGSYNTLNQPSYTDNGDSTVTESVTGLVWAKCSAGLSGTSCATGAAARYTWANALTYCSNNTAGLPGAGWRLPSKTELSWLVKNEGSAPLINVLFPGTVSSTYWTSTSYALNATNAWGVLFYNGYVYSSNKTSSYYVRCVR